MTFLRSPNPLKRVYSDFAGIPNGPLPPQWGYRKFGGGGVPEIFADHIRMGTTPSNNTNTQAMVINTLLPVCTDNQIVRGVTRSAINGLLGGLILKMDLEMLNGVMAIFSTGSDHGIWTVTNGALSKRAGIDSNHAIGDTWALKADGNNYSVIRNPNFNNTGGSVVSTWTDNSNIVKHGSKYRHGGFYVNSDRNSFGNTNWGPGWDNFDFRDLKWVL